MNIFIDPVFEKYYRRKPITLVDIGARGGLQKNWRRARRYLDIIGFEPDKQEFDKLVAQSGQKARIINTALYDGRKRVDFYLTKERGVSSLFEPNMGLLSLFPDAERFKIEETVSMDTDTLDNQLKLNRVNKIDFIKIDTQGGELAILKGSEETIKDSLFGIETEVEFIEIYKGQPLFAEVDAFLRARGFCLFDLRPFYWKRKSGMAFGRAKGQLVFGDALYLRDLKSLGAILEKTRDPEEKKTRVLRVISVCAIYGYLDYAFEIAAAFGGLFDIAEQKILNARMKREVMFRRRFPNFKGRGSMANAMHWLYKIIHPSASGWAYGGPDLGNL